MVKAVSARDTGLELRPFVTMLRAGGKENMVGSFKEPLEEREWDTHDDGYT